METACVNACDSAERVEFCKQCNTVGLPVAVMSEFATHC